MSSNDLDATRLQAFLHDDELDLCRLLASDEQTAEIMRGNANHAYVYDGNVRAENIVVPGDGPPVTAESLSPGLGASAYVGGCNHFNVSMDAGGAGELFPAAAFLPSTAPPATASPATATVPPRGIAAAPVQERKVGMSFPVSANSLGEKRRRTLDGVLAATSTISAAARPGPSSGDGDQWTPGEATPAWQEEGEARYSVRDAYVLRMDAEVPATLDVGTFSRRMTLGVPYLPLTPPQLPAVVHASLTDRAKCCLVKLQRSGNNDGWWVAYHDWSNDLYTVTAKFAAFVLPKDKRTVFKCDIVKMLPSQLGETAHSMEVFSDENCIHPLGPDDPLPTAPLSDHLRAELRAKHVTGNLFFTEEYLCTRDLRVCVFYIRSFYHQTAASGQDQPSVKVASPIFGMRLRACLGYQVEYIYQDLGPIRARTAKSDHARPVPKLLKPPTMKDKAKGKGKAKNRR
eukprot:CAMPEP_0114614784 /NCGR_PEP_ID=MMETSP0168-20121206/5830_1 /TAXON_ID=95228 ORGANISM="Vannella sp., Strain DIVA3 517/6/12" /NCGR_SAMPLE_ID=MMETSP0168 /ASSEMBLY_ACC=CAM_ASM_000044 /LENGTH=457 /DNA_ID=CAMNT_0001825839 /DNA_START=106 /DNA_END=1479 /DNA_ORIENTATION=+